jgi:hypothetical protein
MEKQLDDLITEFMKRVHALVGSSQNVNVNVNLSNTNRLDWNVNIQQSGEDRIGFNKNKMFQPAE